MAFQAKTSSAAISEHLRLTELVEAMPFEIEVAALALEELQGIKPFYQRQIVESIDQQLAHQPLTETRNRKCLVGVQPDFDHQPPLWELRVGEYRVYYSVNESSAVVSIYSIRHKPPHLTTEQVV